MSLAGIGLSFVWDPFAAAEPGLSIARPVACAEARRGHLREELSLDHLFGPRRSFVPVAGCPWPRGQLFGAGLLQHVTRLKHSKQSRTNMSQPYKVADVNLAVLKIRRSRESALA